MKNDQKRKNRVFLHPFFSTLHTCDVYLVLLKSPLQQLLRTEGATDNFAAKNNFTTVAPTPADNYSTGSYHLK